MGTHRMTYSLFPHNGSLQASGVIQEAYALNCPLFIPPGLSPPVAVPTSHCFFSLSSPSVILETVKKAEEGDGIILRLYEAYGGRTAVTLTCSQVFFFFVLYFPFLSLA